jgi:hypothetical protein
VTNPVYRFDLTRMPLTDSQRATAKFFVVALLLFLRRALLGGKMAHDYADGASFYGLQSPNGCRSTSPARGTCNWPSSGLPRPGWAWASLPRRW